MDKGLGKALDLRVKGHDYRGVSIKQADRFTPPFFPGGMLQGGQSRNCQTKTSKFERIKVGERGD